MSSPATSAPTTGRSSWTPLDLGDYLGDAYRTAIAPVTRLGGESDLDFRVRKINYLHVTRLLRILLDRKDRLSMAVGLEVRVPFCDHRLIEYVYNVPWAMKTFDGREKSLLRAATADLLPRSIVERVKSHYPTTHDPAYAAALQRQGSELLADRTHPVFDLVSRAALRELTAADPASVGFTDRIALEQALDIAIWLDIYRPRIVV